MSFFGYIKRVLGKLFNSGVSLVKQLFCSLHNVRGRFPSLLNLRNGSTITKGSERLKVFRFNNVFKVNNKCISNVLDNEYYELFTQTAVT